MGNVLRSDVGPLGVPVPAQVLETRLKRPKPRDVIPELAEKFAEVKRKLVELENQKETLKEQLLKAHEANSLLAQRNTELENKIAEVLKLEEALSVGVEELLSSEVEQESVEEKPQFISRIPRPIRFKVATTQTTVANNVIPFPTPKKEVVGFGNEVKPKTILVSAIKKEEVAPESSPVIDLTVAKVKPAEVITPPVETVITSEASTVQEEVKEPADVVVLQKAEPVQLPEINIIEENVLIRKRKEKLEAVNKQMIQDVETYLFVANGDPIKIAAALNFDLDPKPISKTPTSSPTVSKEVSLERTKSLTPEQKKKVYDDLSLTVDNALLQEITKRGVKLGEKVIKMVKNDDALTIIPQIKTLDAHAVWHDHEDQTVGNIDLHGEMINVRTNISDVILNLIMTGKLLGIDVAPSAKISVAEYFENAQKQIRAALT